MQIIVLGAHRSGTSMVTRLINMMGGYFGIGETSIDVNAENPKGFWERSDVIAVNEALLAHYNCSWDKVDNWPFMEKCAPKDKKALSETLESLKNIVLDLDAHRPWVMKDPRLCLTYPFWREQLEVPVIVSVYRNPEEIARSLKTRNNITFAHSMALWEYYATGIANALRNTPTVYVSHNELLSDPVGAMQKLHEDLQAHHIRGLEMPSEKEITSFIDPTLYRSHGSEQAINDMATGYQRRLIGYINGQEPAPQELQKPTELATDLVASLSQQLGQQEKMESQNHRYSEMMQRNYELESQLETVAQEREEIQDHYQRLLDKQQAEMDNLQESASWRIGNRIVRTLRALTFRSNHAS